MPLSALAGHWQVRERPQASHHHGMMVLMGDLVKSRQRVIDHGEVFTPPEIVSAMIDLVGTEADRIDARFLEPACGAGNFLAPVLTRKLATATARYRGSEFERRHHALLALMSIYGIELLIDNVLECRERMRQLFVRNLEVTDDDSFSLAAAAVLEVNIVQGDALTMLTPEKQPIAFAEWSYLGKGRFHRRDFRFDTLTQMSSFGGEDTLFADLGRHEIFTPAKDHGALTVKQLAGG